MKLPYGKGGDSGRINKFQVFSPEDWPQSPIGILFYFHFALTVTFNGGSENDPKR